MSTFVPTPFSSTFNRSSHSTGMGVLLLVLGVLAILLPFIAGVAITALVGWLLLFAGLAHLVYAWSARGAGSAIWQVLIGLLYVIVGLYFVLHPASGLVTLTFLLAAWFIIEGVLELVVYFRTRGAHHATWGLFNALITLLLGILIWAHWPVSSVWAIGTLIGISLIMSGISRLSFRSRSALGQPAGVL